MTISKKDQERLIERISNKIGTTVATLVLIEVLKLVACGENIDTGKMTSIIIDNIKRTLSRYNITEKPN